MSFDTEYRGTQINIRYLVAFLLDKAFLILAAMVVFAVLFTAVSVMKKDDEIADPEAILSKHRNSLTEEEAAAVEGLYSRYSMCLDYLYGYYGNMQCMTNVYQIKTNPLEAETLSKLLIISEEDYKRISEIIGIDSSLNRKPYEFVSIETKEVGIASFESIKEQNTSVVGHTGLIVTVVVYGKDENICKQVMEVIEESFSDTIDMLETDENLPELVLKGSVISLGESHFLDGRLNEKVGSLVNIGPFLSGISTAASSFSDDQKVYYNALKDYSKGKLGSKENTSSVISLKYPILGAAFGFVFSIGVAVLLYLSNGTVKSNEEIGVRYNIEVTEPITIETGARRHLLRRISDKLRGTETSKTEVNSLIAADSINKTIEKNRFKKVVMLADDSTVVSRAVNKRIEDDSFIDAELIGKGDPNSSPDVLCKISDADAALLVVQLETTKKDTIDKWVALCKRHEKPVCGIITVYAR